VGSGSEYSLCGISLCVVGGGGGWWK